MNFTGAELFQRWGRPSARSTTPISDARPLFGRHSQGNAQKILPNGRGFLLANSPSTVINWSDPKEVANKHYEEALTLAQNFYPISDLRQSVATRSETSRLKNIIGSTVSSTIRAQFVHNDYADTLQRPATDREILCQDHGASTNKRVVGINIWRSVSNSPLERFPLAVYDRTSIDPNDLIYALNGEAPFHSMRTIAAQRCSALVLLLTTSGRRSACFYDL